MSGGSEVKSFYRRRLPHFQGNRKTYFVTFCTKDRWILPEFTRQIVLEHCLYDHEKKFFLYCAVVMPDHVHLIFSPNEDERGTPFGLVEILRGVKGASAHSLNKALGRKGSVWQDESFDHVLRSNEDLIEKLQYVCANPVRKRIVSNEEEYPWLWRWDAGRPLKDDKR